MAENGLTAFQAIRSATLDAATLIKHEDEPIFGILQPGAYADIIAVRGNPLNVLFLFLFFLLQNFLILFFFFFFFSRSI